MTMTTYEQAQSSKILAIYNQVEDGAEDDDLLTKAELDRVLDIQKGGVEAGLGETRNWNGRVYKKTVDGWKFEHKLTAKDPKDAVHERDKESQKTKKPGGAAAKAIENAKEAIKDAAEEIKDAKEKEKKDK